MLSNFMSDDVVCIVVSVLYSRLWKLVSSVSLSDVILLACCLL